MLLRGKRCRGDYCGYTSGAGRETAGRAVSLVEVEGDCCVGNNNLYPPQLSPPTNMEAMIVLHNHLHTYIEGEGGAGA